MKQWALQDAKARFSALVEESIANGPRLVTKRGKPAVVIVPIAEWERHIKASRPFAEIREIAWREAPDLLADD
jgi:antitoxin Phd